MPKIQVKSPITGSVWMQSVGVGQEVLAGTALLLLECMKMEFPLESPCDGVVVGLVDPGTNVQEGQVVAVIESP